MGALFSPSFCLSPLVAAHPMEGCALRSSTNISGESVDIEHWYIEFPVIQIANNEELILLPVDV